MSLTVFQTQVSTAATELVDQEVQRFNEVSAGALILGNGEHIGDYIENTSWQIIGSLAQRRNAYGSGTLTPQEIGQILDRMVKVDGRIGPVQVTTTMMKRLGKDVTEAASVVAAQATEAMLQDYLNTAGAALKTAISTNSNAVTDLSGAKASPVKPSLEGLNRGVRPFGDAYSRLVAWLMDGATFNDFGGEAIKNTDRLFQIGTISVHSDGFGRRYIVSDIPALYTDTGGASLQHALGLSVGAAAIKTSPLNMEAQSVLGEENIKALMQGEYDFTIGIKGYHWDKDTVKSPTDAQIATKANWKQIATSIKDTAGVIVTFGNKSA